MKKFLGLLMVMSVVFSGAAFADTVEGKVSAVDATANTIEVAKTDAATGAVESLKVSVDAATVFTGVVGLAELKAEDSVKIESAKDEATGELKATSVEVVKVVAAV